MARLPLTERTRTRNMAIRNILTSIVVIYHSVDKMAEAMEHEAAIQEKAMSEDLMQKLRERAVNEV
jgi:type IV secretory pathway VirB4 component